MQAEENSKEFITGDIFYIKSDNEYYLYKLLASDDEYDTYHVLMYTPSKHLPTIEELDKLDVFACHSPFAKEALTGGIILTNEDVTADDLIGYHEYLKQTHEPAFYFDIVKNYYYDAIALSDNKKHYEAIDAYSKAIDLFPLFYEAIDNRAFCKMDLALWEEAIEDFRFSLEQNPVSVLAEFSIGECYYKMRQYLKAKEQFEKVLQIEDNHSLSLTFLEKVNAALKA